MRADIETDYLVVGAGAAGMAFTDEILSHSDRTVTIVDRRHAPGGHWVDAYPFVRLHQPSAFYGVSSTKLGEDRFDTDGLNAGFYELAGPDEICAYYEKVMHRRFLESGRVRYFPSADYVGDHRIVARLSGESLTALVRRKLVDTTYLEGSIPANTPPPFEVSEGARCLPAGELTRVADAPERFVIIGAGKTSMDAIVWLLGRGVSPSRIVWIKSREGWWLNRKFQQPLTLLPDLYTGASLQFQAMAEAESEDDLFDRLEVLELFSRVDPGVKPTMFRAAIISEAELTLLRQVEQVVRLGHVRRVTPTEIELEGGSILTTPGTLHVHCAARALPRKPSVPVFEPGRITTQPLRWGFAPFNAALIGFVEAAVEGDDAKNALCPPLQNFDRNRHFLEEFLTSMAGDRARSSHPEVDRWMKSTRLNAGSGVRQHLDDPRVAVAHQRIKKYAGAAAKNLQRLLADQSGTR